MITKEIFEKTLKFNDEIIYFEDFNVEARGIILDNEIAEIGGTEVMHIKRENGRKDWFDLKRFVSKI